ncbi:MAG: transglutaminase family protein [Ferruginibacter sp.]|nr:transglutaminase family protein [Cytophagales bacterium]
MAVRVAIRHHTQYEYDRPVWLFPHVLRLKPVAHSRTPVEAYALNIVPATHSIHWQQDPFGNYQARVVFRETTTHLSITVALTARLVVFNPFDFYLESYAEHFPFPYEETLRKGLVPYLEIAERGPRLMGWLADLNRRLVVSSHPGTVDYLVGLNRLVYQDVAYTTRMEPGVQTSEQTLEWALGSCRDSSWLLVQILRHLGLAARFVSGYLVQLKANVQSQGSVSGPKADAAFLHAWAEVYLPGAGWLGLDPTSGLLAGEGHLPLACTPEPTSAAPVTGSTGPAETTFTFASTVARV